MNTIPLVSIITPSYNQGHFIEETILSVKNQDYPNIEHIIVDGGSTDNTIEILKKYEGTYNMRWISEPDEGQADAVNKGFKMAKGEIIGWLNSDDVYFSKDVISTVVAEFQNTEADVLFGDDVLIDQKGRILKVRIMSSFNFGRMLRYESISQPATFFRRRVIDNCKINPDLEFSMDLEFFLRIAEDYNFKHINKILAGNRIHIKRKMIAKRLDALNESKKVRESYGFKDNLSSRLKILFFDKPSIGMRRLKGLIKMWELSVRKSCFPFIHLPRNKWDFLKTQFGNLNNKILSDKYG